MNLLKLYVVAQVVHHLAVVVALVHQVHRAVVRLQAHAQAQVVAQAVHLLASQYRAVHHLEVVAHLAVLADQAQVVHHLVAHLAAVAQVDQAQAVHLAAVARVEAHHLHLVRQVVHHL